MTKDAIETMQVRILDKEYGVTCPPGEEDALLESARYLDRKLREIRSSGKTIGLERIAVMAALNITHELINKTRDADELEKTMRDRIDAMSDKMEKALANVQQLEL